MLKQVLGVLLSMALSNAYSQTQLESADFEGLRRYFDQKSDHSIQARDVNNLETNLRFERVRSEAWGHQWVPIRPGRDLFRDELNYFEIDLKRFLENQKAENFLDAKRKFYSELSYNRKTHQYERPYAYLSSWAGLNHPPLRTLPSDLSQVVPDLKSRTNLDLNGSNYFKPEFHKTLDDQTGTELTFENDLKYLANRESFEEKIRLIREAKKTFFASVLYMYCDESGDQLVEELAQAVKRGVDVRFMIEGKFTLTEKGCIRKMRKAGIHVLGVSRLLRKGSFQGVYHNKIWIRDSVEAIFGGQNMLDSDHLSTGFNHLNRDTDLLVRKGPMVTDLVLEYALLWERFRRNSLLEKTVKKENPTAKYWIDLANHRKIQERKNGLRGYQFYDTRLKNPETRMKGVCRVLVQPEGGVSPNIGKTILEYLGAAQHQVMMTAPTLSYDQRDSKNPKPTLNNEVAWKLQERARNGLSTYLITNGFDGGNGELSHIIRNWFQRAENKGKDGKAKILKDQLFKYNLGRVKKNHENQLEMAAIPNMNVWTFYQYVHAKLMNFDQIVASVGSWNLDLFSAEMSFETQAFCQDESLSREMDFHFARDLANSLPIFPTQDGNRKSGL